MKRLLVFVVTIFISGATFAQRGYVFTQFNCVPGTCEDTGALASNSISTVVYDVKCSHGGQVNQAWGGQVLVEVLNCSVPHKPHSLVERRSVDVLDDFGVPYPSDYSTQTGELFNAAGETVLYSSFDTSCDGGTTGVTQFGFHPCPRTAWAACGISESEYYAGQAECRSREDQWSWIWDDGSCSCQVYGSPIVIDTSGDGFQLSNAASGVSFDLTGSGHAKQVAWTAPGPDDAFLVLDRDANGTIDNGKEMFGNYTPQPPSPTPNGFLALAEYDKAETGGNGDGTIDNRDTVSTRLRLWRDLNHNGMSEPGELFELPVLGVYSISLEFRESRRTDDFGNVFRYRSKVNEHMGSAVGTWAYDVFFAPAASNTSSSKLRGPLMQVRSTAVAPTR